MIKIFNIILKYIGIFMKFNLFFKKFKHFLNKWLQNLKFYVIIKHSLNYAFLAQLDRASVYGTEGQGFESLRTHQPKPLRAFFIKILKMYGLYLIFMI